MVLKTPRFDLYPPLSAEQSLLNLPNLSNKLYFQNQISQLTSVEKNI